MEYSVQDLLDKINKEGTEAALKEKARIIEEANAEAKKIVSDATVNAEKIVGDAKKEASKITEQSLVSLSQASRDVRLKLKDELNELLATALNTNIKETLKADDYVKIIKNATEASGEEKPNVELSTSLYKSTAESLVKAIKDAKVSENTTLKSGFRIVLKDGKAYYDFTDKEIFDLLSNYLSEGLNRILQEK